MRNVLIKRSLETNKFQMVTNIYGKKLFEDILIFIS